MNQVAWLLNKKQVQLIGPKKYRMFYDDGNHKIPSITP